MLQQWSWGHYVGHERDLNYVIGDVEIGVFLRWILSLSIGWTFVQRLYTRYGILNFVVVTWLNLFVLEVF